MASASIPFVLQLLALSVEAILPVTVYKVGQVTCNNVYVSELLACLLIVSFQVQFSLVYHGL